MEIRKNFLLIACLLIGVAALYGQFLWNPIVFDDLPLFMADLSGHQPIQDMQYSPFHLRSLPYATLAWGKALFGGDMLHYRVENLVLHFAVAAALYLFLLGLFKTLRNAQGKDFCSHEVMAFFAALLFALHPVSVYAAGYLIQRTMLMATLFCLISMWAYAHGSIRGKASWMWASVVFYYLAAYAKEHAIMLPAAMLALTVLLHEDWRAKMVSRWPVFVAYAVIALSVIAAKLGILGTAYEIYAPEMLREVDGKSNYLLSILTQSWLFFKYIALWLFPNPNWMSVDMREPFAESLWSGYLAAFILFVVWGGFAAWLLLKRGKAGLVGFAMLFPWLMFMTEFSVVRIQESFVLYRSYLWAAGACVVLPILLDMLDKKIAGAIVAMVALAMFPISMDRLASFGHPLLLWDDAEKLVRDRQYLPGVERIYYNRGTEYLKVDEYDAAISDMTVAIRLRPDWPFPYNNLGAAFLKKHQWSAAVEAFSEAIDIAERKNMGQSARPYLARAQAYEELGRSDLARRDYEVTCRLARKGCEKMAQ